MAISVWFTWGVFGKYAKEETAFRQYEEEIEVHPTIALCDIGWKSDRSIITYEFQKDFFLTYTIYQHNGVSIEDEVALKIGENDLENSGKIVNLSIIYTYHNRLCFTLNTNRNVDGRETEITVSYNISYINERPPRIFVLFTSEENSYGITRMDWRDGKAYSFYVNSGFRKDVTLTVEKNINLKCNEGSFYTYVASRLSEQNLMEKCNDTCLTTSLPNDPYPICPNWKDWYDTYLYRKRLDCDLLNLFETVSDNDEYGKTCITTQYSSLSQESSDDDAKFIGKINHLSQYGGERGEGSFDNDAKIKYKFHLPLRAKVYEEYFIIDTIGLIGSVGGTLGVFIGFSFSNLIISIIEYIKTLMESQLTSRKKFSQTVWKCFEWTIYLSLMTTAIIFAREVIEKFFHQNTGIKQNMEKIEQHPTITICPFIQSPYKESKQL